MLQRTRGKRECALAHLNQLHEILKVLLLVDGELAVVIDDAVVLHLPITADTQGVISRIVGAFPHQEQARLWRVQEPLGLLASDLPMKPAGRRAEAHILWAAAPRILIPTGPNGLWGPTEEPKESRQKTEAFSKAPQLQQQSQSE